MNLSKLQSEAVKLFKEKFGIKSILHKIDGTMEIKYLIDEKQEQFLSDQIQKAVEETRKEDRMEIENYFGHILNDGSGKPIRISTEEIGKDLIEVLSIQSKGK